MITSDELSELRKGGKSDDDLLRLYREFDPSNNDDIDFMLKDGRKPKQILDDLARFHGSSEAPKAEPAPDHMADKGILEKTRGALQFGGANLLAGLSATAKAAKFQKTADFLSAGAKSITPTDYDPAGAHFDVTDPKSYGYAPRALLEGAPGVAADLAGGAVGGIAGPAGAAAGFGAVNAARNFGPNLEARMEHQAPGAEASGMDYAAAGASTAAEAALSRLGINPAISSVAKGAGLKAMAQVPGLIAKAAGAETAAGAAGDVINQVGRTAGTQDGLSVDPKEAANVGALSGATGGVIRAARGVADVSNATRFAGVNEDAAARAVARMDANGIKPDNAESAYQAVSMARKTLNTEINDAHSVLKPRLKSEGNDTDTDATRTLLKTTLTQLKADGEANPEHLAALRERLGDTQEGSRLLDLMEERHALNQLASKGNFDAKDGTFAGGVAANKTVDGLLNPKHYLGAKLLGGAGVAGVAELPMFAQIGVLGPALAKLAAAQAGTYGAVRTLDNVTGMRNPTQEFANRFRGMQKVSGGEDLPSFRQEAADQAAQAQAAKDQARADKGAGKADQTEFKDNSRSLKEAVQLATATRKLREAAQADEAKQVAARGKQEDAAWKLKAAQEAQDARNAQQADRAWSQREDAPEARQAQEEAMWKQLESQRSQAANDDLTASEGIRSGRMKLLENALLAGQATKKLRDAAEAAKGKESDKAWSVKSKLDAEDAKRAEQADKAWAEREKAPKAPSEDDLWVAHEKAQGDAEGSDLEAQAGIQAGYKALAQRALAAQQARGKQEDTAWTQKGRQDTAQSRLEATVNKDYGRAEAQRNARSPEAIKKAQEEAMWRDQEAPGGPMDWSDQDSIAAIQREISARQKASEFLVKQSKKATEKVPQVVQQAQADASPEGVPEALKVRVRAQAKATKSAEPKSEDVNPDTIRITHGDQVIERPSENIRNKAAYVTKTKARMADRQTFVDDILSETGNRQKPITDAMLTKLNNVAKNWGDAQSIIEDYVNELPEKHWGKAWDAYNKHEGKLRGSYGE